MAIDYAAMLDRKDLGATLDERFVATMEFHARNGRDIALNIERMKKFIEENERHAREVDEWRNRDMDGISDLWRAIESAPIDGTPIIGMMWDEGIMVAQVVYSHKHGKWHLHNHIGYDLDGDELQPTHWMPL